MTLTSYTQTQLDHLALRLIDVTAQLRLMAQRCREQGASAIELHDKKALEWLGKLEDWAQRSVHEVDLELRRQAGAAKARSLRKENARDQ